MKTVNLRLHVLDLELPVSQKLLELFLLHVLVLKLLVQTASLGGQVLDLGQ
jgi:hypothetical protein